MYNRKILHYCKLVDTILDGHVYIHYSVKLRRYQKGGYQHWTNLKRKKFSAAKMFVHNKVYHEKNKNFLSHYRVHVFMQ